MFKLHSALIALLSIGFAAADDTSMVGQEQDETITVVNNLVDGCVIDYNPLADIDYFPSKYSSPIIQTYGDIDIFGEKFVPHNTTDYLEITYHKTYKIVTNKHQNPPRSYLLYQCGTEIPQDVVDANDFDVVVPVPLQNGIAITQTTQIPYLELLGLREEVVAYIGSAEYVSSPCMKHMLEEETIETFFDWDSDTMNAMLDDFRARNPDTIIVSGPTNNVVGENVVVSSATQERTNVATFDWIHFYAAFFNMEGEAKRIAQSAQDSYDCSSDVARDIAKQQRELEVEEESFEKPVIFWGSYYYDWSVAECPTWDHTYYCEYAEHCGATILSRPEGVGFNQTWGTNVYWYLKTEEVFELAKDADIFIYSGTNWDATYAKFNETLDQFKSVQNKMVFDIQGQGPAAWFEQRYAEYDVVGLDFCDAVGHTSATGPVHERRWLRNVFTEPIGSLPTCDVEGGEVSQPYVPPGQECVRPQDDSVDFGSEDSVEEDLEDGADALNESSAVSASLTGLVLVLVATAIAL